MNEETKIRNIIVDSLQSTAEEFIPSVFSWKNYQKIFKDGIIQTPVEKVKIGPNQFIKLCPSNRNNLMLAIRRTLEKPSLVLAKETYDEKTESFKPVHLYGKSFINKDNNHTKTVESVIVFKEGENIAMSLHNKSLNDFVKQIKTADDIIYLDKDISRVITVGINAGGNHVMKDVQELLSSAGQKTVPFNSDYNINNILSTKDYIQQNKIETGNLIISKKNFFEYFKIFNQHKLYKHLPNKIASELFNYHVSNANKAEMKKWLEEKGFRLNIIANKQIKTADQIIYADKTVSRVCELVNDGRAYVRTEGKNAQFLNIRYNKENILSIPELIANQKLTYTQVQQKSHKLSLPTDHRDSVRSPENKIASASQVQGENTMTNEETMAQGSGAGTAAATQRKDFSNSFFWQQNAQLLYESVKDGSHPALSKEGLQKDGTIVMTPEAVRSASSGHAFKGNNQLIAQIALKRLNLKDKEILTYEQAGEKNIKRGSKHFVLTTFDTETKEAKRYNYYPKSAVIDANRIPDPSEKARTPYEIAKLRKVSAKKHPDITIDARGEKEAEAYVAKYLAASAMGAKFVTDEKTISAMQKNMQKEMEPSIAQKTFVEVYQFGNRASVKCREVCSEIRKNMEMSNDKKKEQSKSKNLVPQESMNMGDEGMGM